MLGILPNLISLEKVETEITSSWVSSARHSPCPVGQARAIALLCGREPRLHPCNPRSRIGGRPTWSGAHAVPHLENQLPT